MPINIVALGGSGAGKTLYLASLYHKLAFSHPDVGNSFLLQIVGETEYKATIQRQALNKYYDNVKQKQNDFPAGTIGLDRWEFQCKVKNKSDNYYNAGSFTFVDYAGGLVNEVVIGSEQDRQQLNDDIKKANIILVLLDGIKVIDLLRNRNQKELETWLNIDIRNMLTDINTSHTDCPIHFVITKWDCLVYLKLDNLKEIGKKLLKIHLFQQIIETTNRKIRLLPVSSLGMNFAIPEYNFQKKFIKMKKIGRPLADINPYLVEIPLAYALIDSLIHQLDKIEARDKKRNYFVKWFKMIMSFFNDTAEFLPPPYNVLGKISVKVIRQATSNINPHGIIFEGINVANVSSDEQAIKILVNSCVKTIQSFQDNFPGSLLYHYSD